MGNNITKVEYFFFLQIKVKVKYFPVFNKAPRHEDVLEEWRYRTNCTFGLYPSSGVSKIEE
jgi:hypothetical protein